MRSTLTGIVTALALAGAASLAIAQQAPGGKSQGPAARDRAPAGEGQGGPGASQQMRDKQAPKGMDQPRATERPDKDRPKATERPDTDRPKATERPDKDRPKAAERKGGRGQLSEQQRSKMTQRLRQTRVEQARIDVDVNVGSRIPRSVRLHTLPPAIIEIAPDYRGYRYVVLENETIVIVDPQNYVVVDVIRGGSRQAGRGGSGGRLALSAEERRFIYRNVPKDRTAGVRVRLALGVEVPRDVDLRAFPSRIVERVPEVGDYRYVVAQDRVVIVDPDDYSVVLVVGQ